MSYKNFRGFTAEAPAGSDAVAFGTPEWYASGGSDQPVIPGGGSNPLVDTSTGPLKLAFWAVVAVVLWKWMKK